MLNRASKTAKPNTLNLVVEHIVTLSTCCTIKFTVLIFSITLVHKHRFYIS